MTDASYHHSQRYTVDFTAEGIYTVHHTTQRLQMHCVTWPITCTARRDPSHALCTAWRDPSHALRDVTHHMHCATWPITLPSLMATGIMRCCRSLYTLKLRNASRMLTLQWQYRQLSHRTSTWYVRRQGKEDNVLTSYNLLYPHH